MSPLSDSWVVLAEGTRRRWGGDLRRHYLLRGLAERTGATVLEDWRAQRLVRTLKPIVGRRWKIWRRRALVAAVEVLEEEQLEPIERYGRPFLLDIHDDALLQGAALGIEPSAEAAAAITERSARNLARFRWLLAPSLPFAVLAGLPLERLIVAPNGTASDVVRPAPWPATPAVAFVSGAAPRRGIEELIAAVRLVRGSLDDVRLDLWLAATGDDSRIYLDGLMAAVAAEPWIRIGQTPYEQLGASVGRASVVAIPTPAHPYWNSVAPIKVFDNLAAGRPIVTTPRTETARVVVQGNAGIVTADDSPEAIATALLRLLTDDALARRMGANARAVAEREYDWAVIGRRLADDVLATTRWSRLLGSPRAIR